MSTHTCPVTGCTAEIITARLMCLPHWSQVPDDLKSAVNRAWGAYAREPLGDAGKIQRRYYQVRGDAIRAVNDQIPQQVRA